MILTFTTSKPKEANYPTLNKKIKNLYSNIQAKFIIKLAGKIHVPSQSFSSTDGRENQDGKDQNNQLTIKQIQHKETTPTHSTQDKKK